MEYRFVDRWIAYKRNIQKVRDSSLHTYKMNIVSLLDELNKTKQLKSEIELYKSITRFDLEDLINDKINNNVSENYLNLKIVSVKDFFNYLYENEVIENNVFCKIKQIKNPETKRKDYITVDEVRKMIKSSYERKRGDRNFELISHRLRAITSILVGSGLRISELLNLKMSDLKLVEEECYIINYTEDEIKNHMNKTIAICGKAKQYLDEYLEVKNRLYPNSEYIFVSGKGKQFNEKDSIIELNKWYNRAGLEGKHLCNHSFRTTFKMACMDRNISDQVVKSIAGWKLSKVEQAYTKDLNIETLKKVCNII